MPYEVARGRICMRDLCKFHDGTEGQHRYRKNVGMRVTEAMRSVIAERWVLWIVGARVHRSVIEVGYEMDNWGVTTTNLWLR